VVHFEQPQQLAGARLRLVQRYAVGVHGGEPHVLQHREMLEEVMELEHQSDGPS
jgi:hypothetical protein